MKVPSQYIGFRLKTLLYDKVLDLPPPYVKADTTGEAAL